MLRSAQKRENRKRSSGQPQQETKAVLGRTPSPAACKLQAQARTRSIMNKCCFELTMHTPAHYLHVPEKGFTFVIKQFEVFFCGYFGSVPARVQSICWLLLESEGCMPTQVQNAARDAGKEVTIRHRSNDPDSREQVKASFSQSCKE